MRIPIFLAAVLLASGAPVGSSDTTSAPFIETFDGDLTDWTLEGGVKKDCATSVEGCALRVAPTCCSRYEEARRNLSHALSTTERSILSFGFQSGSIYGNLDSYVDFVLDNGYRLRIGTSEGYNNGVTLHIINASGGTETAHVNFAKWPVANRWYSVEVELDPTNETVQARLLNNGHLIGASQAFSIPPAGAVVGAVIGGVAWSGLGSPFYYDTLCIGTAPLPEACFIPDIVPYVTLSISPFAARFDEGFTFELHAAPGHNRTIAEWELMDGVGRVHAGEGAPPATLHITFDQEHVGYQIATFRIVQSDGQTHQATRMFRVLGLPPVVIDLRRDIETPVSRSLDGPTHVDTVTVRADYHEPDEQETVGILCWSVQGVWGAQGCRFMEPEGPETYTAAIPYKCAGATIDYYVRVIDPDGFSGYSETQTVTYEGVRAPGDAQCALETHPNTRGIDG